MCREDRLGGGVSIFVHDSVKILSTLNTLNNFDFESIALQVKYKNKVMCVTEFYRPPNCDNTGFMESLVIFMNQCN